MGAFCLYKPIFAAVATALGYTCSARTSLTVWIFHTLTTPLTQKVLVGIVSVFLCCCFALFFFSNACFLGTGAYFT